MSRQILPRTSRFTSPLLAATAAVLIVGCGPSRPAAINHPSPSLTVAPSSPPPATAPTPAADNSLHLAIAGGESEKALFLIRSGADVNSLDSVDASPPLYYAALSAHCQMDVMKALVDRGAEINRRGKGGMTPLHAACESRCPEIVEYLLSKGADVSAREKSGDTPLHVAAYCGWDISGDKIVRLLVAHGADVNALGAEGRTPLDYALMSRNGRNISLLRELGAKTSPPSR